MAGLPSFLHWRDASVSQALVQRRLFEDACPLFPRFPLGLPECSAMNIAEKEATCDLARKLIVKEGSNANPSQM